MMFRPVTQMHVLDRQVAKTLRTTDGLLKDPFPHGHPSKAEGRGGARPKTNLAILGSLQVQFCMNFLPKYTIPMQFVRIRSTEVGPPERTRQTVREVLNDVWVGGCSASNRLY